MEPVEPVTVGLIISGQLVCKGLSLMSVRWTFSAARQSTSAPPAPHLDSWSAARLSRSGTGKSLSSDGSGSLDESTGLLGGAAASIGRSRQCASRVLILPILDLKFKRGRTDSAAALFSGHCLRTPWISGCMSRSMCYVYAPFSPCMYSYCGL